MRCIAIAVNGQSLCVAGISNATLIAPSIHGAVSAEYPPSLNVSGMCELDKARSAHVYWCEDLHLKAGDCVRLAFVESEQVSPPLQIKPTDSAEYLKEQREFEEIEKSFVPDRTPMQRTSSTLAFECMVNAMPVAVARFSEAEEHILCTVHWDAWRPEVCRVYVRSFGNKSRPEPAVATEWLRTNLALGDIFDVRLAA